MNVLWTGFEPFGEHEYNPSWTVAQAAADRSEGRALELPVHFDVELEADGWPDLICLLGLGASRSRICLERRATNNIGQRPDNQGVVDGGAVESEGPERRCTPLQIGSLLRALEPRLKASKLPEARVSEDCGDYVCNALYFRTLADRATPTLFIHVPNLTGRQATRLGAILGALMSGDVGRSILRGPEARQ